MLTVGQLKDFIKDLNDDVYVVLITQPDELFTSCYYIVSKMELNESKRALMLDAEDNTPYYYEDRTPNDSD